MGILNAYYFPDSDYRALYATVTPVNTFRIIFNKYFETRFEIIKDEIYVNKDKNNMTEFKNVTNQITF